ncbi:rRNA pseudouridine synthase [Candidatus Falkowbacteria bacterium]|nr:rRNA pseudouridine synthase [Candidatus Falkowbacteria bacterium]
MNKAVLQKFIAEAGFCSRRQAQTLIESGRVMVNGKAAELGMRVSLEDEVKIDGKVLGLAKSKIYIILNKSVGYACTHAKVKGEKNVYDLVRLNEKLFVVGRLDKNSRGLVLLTNDGALAERLAHPRYEHEKEYAVKVKDVRGRFDARGIVEIMEAGVDIGEGDGVVRAKSVKYVGADPLPAADPKNSQSRKKDKRHNFRIILTYGKKRQIRRMFKAIGCEVVDLQRTRIGSLRLNALKENEWRKLTEFEIKRLKAV